MWPAAATRRGPRRRPVPPASAGGWEKAGRPAAPQAEVAHRHPRVAKVAADVRRVKRGRPGSLWRAPYKHGAVVLPTNTSRGEQAAIPNRVVVGLARRRRISAPPRLGSGDWFGPFTSEPAAAWARPNLLPTSTRMTTPRPIARRRADKKNPAAPAGPLLPVRRARSGGIFLRFGQRESSQSPLAAPKRRLHLRPCIPRMREEKVEFPPDSPPRPPDHSSPKSK